MLWRRGAGGHGDELRGEPAPAVVWDGLLGHATGPSAVIRAERAGDLRAPVTDHAATAA